MHASTAPLHPDIAPARAALDEATARTAAASTVLDRQAAAQAEMDAFDAYWHTGPDAQAELEAGI